MRWEASAPYSSTDTDSKKSHFILIERSYLNMIDNLPIAVHAFPMRMLTSLSVDEILLPKYVNCLRISVACHLK